MDLTQLNVLISLALSLLGGAIGYWLKHYLDKKKELIDQVNIQRRLMYQDFINLMIDILFANKQNKPMKDGDLVKKLYDIYKKQILYASPSVVNTFGDMFQELYKSNSGESEMDVKTLIRKLTRIMYAMRDDIGLENRGLGEDGVNLLRGLFTDFDTKIK